MKEQYDVLLHIPTLEGGGAERVAVDLARYFAGNGISTAIFLHEETAAYDVPEGVRLFVSRRRGHLGRVAEFRALLTSVEPRTVLSFLPYANLISLLSNAGLGNKTRLIVSEHLSYANYRAAGWKERLKFALVNALYPQAHTIVAVSNGVAEELKGRLRCAAKSKVKVIHNPCFVAHAMARPAVRDGAMPLVLAVGRLVKQKGFDTLIKAFARVHAQLPEARLTIVGEGSERDALVAMIDEFGLGDVVTLPGFTRDIAAYYRQAHVFVCASRAEGFGNVIVEAMSFGLPVVSTSCKHGPQEILKAGRYGMLIPVEDDQALAEAIVETLRTPPDPQRQVGRAGDFSIETIGRQYLDVMGFAR